MESESDREEGKDRQKERKRAAEQKVCHRAERSAAVLISPRPASVSLPPMLRLPAQKHQPKLNVSPSD